MVMANDADCIEVRAIAQRMAVGNHDNIVMIFDRRPDGGINAQIRRPSGNEQPIRSDPFQLQLQVGPRKRII
jgi:hypothetical protein